MRKCHFCKQTVFPWEEQNPRGLGHEDCELAVAEISNEIFLDGAFERIEAGSAGPFTFRGITYAKTP